MNDIYTSLLSKINQDVLDDIKAYPDSIREYDMTPDLCIVLVCDISDVMKFNLKQ